MRRRVARAFRTIAVVAGLCGGLATAVRAEEAGSGHYAPGGAASFIAQHLPLGKAGVTGVGANAFYYQQITADSGSGAVLGDLKGNTVGIGPVVSFITKLGNADVAAELEWLPEMRVENRTKDDSIWFKVGVAF